MSLRTLYDEASLWMTPSGYEDGKAYSIKPVPVYGSEEITNGDFSNGYVGWGLSGNPSNYSVEVVDHDGKTNALHFTTTSTNEGVNQNTLQGSKLYKVKFDLKVISGSVYVGSSSSKVTGGNLLPSTWTTYQVDWTSADSYFRFYSASAAEFYIDNVSVQEIVSSGDFTFSRGSNLAATRVGPTGLIEKGRENLLTYSNDFSQWSNANTTEASGFEGYDGTNDAWEIEKTAASAYSSINKSITATSGIVTISAYVKKGTLSVTSLYASGGTNPYILFSFDSATIVAQRPGLIDTNVEDAGNGWYRISFTTTESISSITLHPDWSGVNTGTIYVQDVQVEKSLVATDYIESGATTGKAGLLEDEPRLDYSEGATCPSLLLEPQRSNLLSHSEYFGASYWTKTGSSVVSGFTSPEGLSNAYKLVEDSANSTHFINSSEVASPDTTYSSSVYIKANGRNKVAFRENSFTGKYASFNLSDGTLIETNGVSASIESASNGWYRINYELTSGSNYILGIYLLSDSYTSGDPYSSPYQGDGTSGVYIYGAQIEAGSYPTSYIPTYGSSVTRSSDNCENTNLDLLGQDAATYFLESTPIAIISNNILEVRGNGSTNDRLLMQTNSSGVLRILVRNSGSTILDSNISSAVSAGTKIKVALKYTSTNISVFVDGVKKVDSDLSVNFGSPLDWINLEGTATANNDALEHHQFLFFPTALTDSECIALTTI